MYTVGQKTHRSHFVVTMGATLHQKVVVTGVGDILQARGARVYNEGLGAEPPAGSRGKATDGGSRGEAPLKLKNFGKTTSKSVHKFSTCTTYMQRLVSYFADKKTSVTFLFGVPEALNPTHWDGNFSLFQ